MTPPDAKADKPDLIAEAITEAFGERCPDFDANCFCCQAWERYDSLTASGWRSDMENAPRDGTEVLLAAIGQEYRGKPVDPRVTIGRWASEEECRIDIGDCGGDCRCREYEYLDPYWISWDGGFTVENPPTHWRHLPQPPISEGE